MIPMQILFFAIIIFCIFCPTSTADADQTCYEKFKTENPELEQRFGERFVHGICAKSRAWVQQADSTNKPSLTGGALGAPPPAATGAPGGAAGVPGPPPTQNNPNLSPEQRAYFESVTQCSDPDCINEPPPSATPAPGAPATPRKIRPPPRKGTRKEIRSMTDDERNRWFSTLNTLKAAQIGNMTKYDIMIVYHTPDYSPEAHFGAAFLPFHREFLHVLEKSMRAVDPNVSLAYWDSTLDYYLPDSKDSILWSDEFMGNGDGEVVTGPFKNWTILKDPNLPPEIAVLTKHFKLVRQLGQNENGTLFNHKDIDDIMKIKEFKSLTFCVNPLVEAAHGALHDFIGGHMSNLQSAVNDPCFFLVHTWVDYLWEEWREKHQTREKREKEYSGFEGPFFDENCNKLAHPNEPMKPFNYMIKEGLSNKYTDTFYTYESRPTCPKCNGSPYLYCDVKNNRCLSKIRVNGNCTGYEGKDICHKSVCLNGVCTASNDSTNLTYPDAPGCHNFDRCCDYWAGKGECKNFEWMSSVGCKLACDTCKVGEERPNIRNGSCSDYYPQLCPKYKANGLCVKNSTWMEENCKLSCQVCSRPASYFTYFCEISKHDKSDGCKNYDKNCDSWAKKGDCETNSWWMKAQCPLACKACT